LPLFGLAGTLVEKMTDNTNHSKLALQLYLEKIQTVIKDYHLSNDNISDPEVYYGRIDGQDSVCWSLIDDLKYNINNKETILELDAAIRKNKIDIAKSGKDYKLLYKKLLEIKIDVCLKQVELFKTGSFTPNEYDKASEDKGALVIKKPINQGREERSTTYNQRVIINAIVKRMREKSPYVTQSIIAEDAADEFNKKHSKQFGKEIKPGTILKEYSDEL
jgi:hypothetical protein